MEFMKYYKYSHQSMKCLVITNERMNLMKHCKLYKHNIKLLFIAIYYKHTMQHNQSLL